jgi:alkanesulfonate monooxygenase SsuD/methylene tetrahydromethanopterin reductase-like flavin-dependent oxidoreductase (luciferase family)
MLAWRIVLQQTSTMSDVDAVRAAAGRHPADDRAALAAELIQSLDEAEAEEAAAWYAERDQRVAALFVEALETALHRIVEAPGRWPVYLHGTRRVRLA